MNLTMSKSLYLDASISAIHYRTKLCEIGENTVPNALHRVSQVLCDIIFPASSTLPKSV